MFPIDACVISSEPTPGGFLREYTPPSLERPSGLIQTPLGYALRLNVAWLPQLVQNMTYLLIDRYPCLQTNYQFDSAGFWSEYWPAAFRRRISTERRHTSIDSNVLLLSSARPHEVLQACTDESSRYDHCHVLPHRRIGSGSHRINYPLRRALHSRSPRNTSTCPSQ